MLVAVERKPMRAHGGSEGGSGWFGGGVAAAPLPLPYCFGAVLLFISFAPSVNNVLPSLQLLRGGAGGGDAVGQTSVLMVLQRRLVAPNDGSQRSGDFSGRARSLFSLSSPTASVLFPLSPGSVSLSFKYLFL